MPNLSPSNAQGAARRRVISYVLQEKSGLPDWDLFQQFSKKELDTPLADWQVDLRQVQMFDSLSIGNLIALNGQLAQRGNRLKVLVGRDTNIDRLLRSVKIERLIPLHYPE